jgi:ArsR family transcriptional regulator, arsenate/arsenite/antimonite-responsive transcriptional repressor
MTQTCNQYATPKLALKKRAKVDKLLDPEFFKALSDPNRTRVLACLIKCARPCSVTEVAECSSVDFSMVARQLAVLAKAGLLEANKDGRTMWYSARKSHLGNTFRLLAEAVEEWNSSPCTEKSSHPQKDSN